MVSAQGRNLALIILGGLVIGAIASSLIIDGYRAVLYLVQSNSEVERGWYWQLVTSLIVVFPDAGGVADSLLNAVAVIWLDGFLSGMLEAKEYYYVFLASGISGNILGLANGPSFGSFGASGGIFGLFSAVIAADFIVNRKVDFVLGGWFAAIFIFSSFLVPQTDWLGHLGGAASGALLGVIIGERRRTLSGLD